MKLRNYSTVKRAHRTRDRIVDREVRKLEQRQARERGRRG